MIRSYKDLKVYQLSFAVATQVFRLSKVFPKEELYTLTDQLRRSSRSVPANLVEGWAKRHYANIFRRHIQDSIGSANETKLWLDFALDCGYLGAEEHLKLIEKYEEVCRMLDGLYNSWRTRSQGDPVDAVVD